MPGIVASRQYVAQAADAAVILLEVRAYSQGCLLEFLAVTRSPSDAASSPYLDLDFGTRLAEHPIVKRLDEPTPGTPRLWISPLPPVEGFNLVTNWTEHNILDQVARIDGSTIRQAAWDSFPGLPAAE